MYILKKKMIQTCFQIVLKINFKIVTDESVSSITVLGF